jgi:PAS domain-containing protein
MAGGGWVATHEDVTEKVRAEKMNEQQKFQLDAALENISQGFCLFDKMQRLIVCNKRYAELYGLNDEQTKPGTELHAILQYRIARGTAPDDHESYVNDRINEVTANKPYQITNRLSNGRHVSVVHRPMAGGGWVATHEDVTEEKRREESFRLLFERNPVPMWVINSKSLCFLAINDAAVTHYGYSREQLMSMTVQVAVTARMMAPRVTGAVVCCTVPPALEATRQPRRMRALRAIIDRRSARIFESGKRPTERAVASAQASMARVLVSVPGEFPRACSCADSASRPKSNI